MKTKILAIIILLILAVCGLTACDKGKNPPDKPPEAGKVEKELIIYRTPVDSGPRLVAEKRIIALSKGEELEVAAKLIVEKPSVDTKKARNSFPKGTRVLTFKLREGIAEINLSKEFAARKASDYTNLMMVYGAVNTMTEFPEVKKVRFLVEGKPLEVLGPLDMEEPIGRNKDFLPQEKGEK